jgi:hypothetical protein
MTPEEIRSAILADPNLKRLAELGADNQIAPLLPPDVVPTDFILTEGGVLNTFGIDRGTEILDGLDAASTANGKLGKQLKRLLKLMGKDGLNLAHKDAGPMLDQLAAANLITVAEAAQAKGLATRTTPQDVTKVSEALLPLRPDGKVGPLN